jgi:hypothetical protein
VNLPKREEFLSQTTGGQEFAHAESRTRVAPGRWNS